MCCAPTLQSSLDLPHKPCHVRSGHTSESTSRLDTNRGGRNQQVLYAGAACNPSYRPETDGCIPHHAQIGTALGLAESADSLGLVVFHVEDGIELGDLEQIMHFLG